MPGRILIVDDVPTNRIVLKVKLATAHYEILNARTGAEALDQLSGVIPDLVITNVHLPDMSGIDLCCALKARPECTTLPILMITAEANSAAKLAALESGADDFLCQPLDALSLRARVRSLLRAHATREELQLREATALELGLGECASPQDAPARIALVSEKAETAMRWRSGLQPLLDHRAEIIRPDDVLLKSRDHEPADAYVIEAKIGGSIEGLRLLAELRSRGASRHAAILVVHGADDRECAAMALDLGANDLLVASAAPEEMAVRLRTQLRRKAEADRLRHRVWDGLRLAVTDPLTGLYNRRYALPHLERISERARASNRQFAVMLADVDRFKPVNDRFGHAAGDEVLCAIGSLLCSNLRDPDFVARIGGEEFLVVLTDTTPEIAQRTAERLRRAVRKHRFRLRQGGEVNLTLSIGLALGGADAGAEPVAQVLDQADRALYRAKALGRDTVTLSPRSAA